MAGAGDEYATAGAQLWLYNGNGRGSKLLKSWEESEFQATLAAQHSKDFELTVGAYAAALGTRGDYFLLKVPCVGVTDGAADAAVTVANKLYVEIMDILGCPNDVQLGKVKGYGKHSPFDSPDVKVTDEMKVGIEAEKLSILVNTAVPTSTYVTQKVAGEDDSRVQAKWENANPAGAGGYPANNTLLLRLKPTSSGVFLIRYDSAVWILPATASFFERED